MEKNDNDIKRMVYLFIIIIFLLFLAPLFIFWRFFYFYRDPQRTSPQGKSILSPADGTVVYVETVRKGEVPISIKKNRTIRLSEITKNSDFQDEDAWIIGVFMHPTSAHINRAPIDGLISRIEYTKAKNRPMTLMWWRVLLRLKPYESNSTHIMENERNMIRIDGEIPIIIVQIADIYVSKIICNVLVGEKIKRGEKIGSILIGSQVDLIFPKRSDIKVFASKGQKVKAGEDILATYGNP